MDIVRNNFCGSKFRSNIFLVNGWCWSRLKKVKYTEQQWSREIGWGKLPEKYKYYREIIMDIDKLREELENEKI